jgi:hypothetical protein
MNITADKEMMDGQALGFLRVFVIILKYEYLTNLAHNLGKLSATYGQCCLLYTPQS